MPDPQKEMQRARREKEIEKKAFWKGFGCAFLVMLGVLAVIGAILFVIAVVILGSSFVGDSLTGESEDDYYLVSYDERVAEKMGLIESYLKVYGLDEVDDEVLEEYIYRGMMAGTDDLYAEYYTEDELISMMDSSEGTFCGIGASFSQNMMTGTVVVADVYEGTPAEEGGLKIGDILYMVDGEDVTGYDLTYTTTNLIKGEENTQLVLTVIRDEKEVELMMTRRMVEIPSVEYEMLQGKIGLIQIISFDEITGRQFMEAVESLQADGMKSLIIDLRNNGGGRVTAAEEIGDFLLPEGLIYYTEYKDGTRIDVESDAACLGIPMVVLMNEYSASASEILAGALKDHGAAQIVGTQSYGKGIVQSIIDLEDGTAIRLTTSRYYTPNGNNIHEVGIEPDIIVEMPEGLLEQGAISHEEDPQLQKAIEVLQQ